MHKGNKKIVRAFLLPSPALLLLLAAVLTFCLLFLLFFPYTMDDAFISFRYASHFANHGTLSWDSSGAPVEGYTNFAWVCMLAVIHLLQLDPVLSSKLLACICTLLTVFVLIRIADTIVGSHGVLRVVPALVFLAIPMTAFHAVEGLETSLYTLTLAIIVLFAFKIHYTQSKKWVSLFFPTILFAGLIRPEGVLFGLILLVIMVFGSTRKKLRSKRSLVTMAVAFLLGVLYFLWRWKYFGMLFPLPFYLKHGEGIIHPQGVTYVVSFLWLYAGLPFLAALTLYFRGKQPEGLSLIIIPVVGIMLFYLGVDPIMGTAHRYLMPLLPLLSLLILPVTSHNEKSGLIFSLTSALLMMSLAWSVTFSHLRTEASTYSFGLNNAHVAIGRMLHSTYAHPETRVLVCGDAGAIPYYSEFRTIDIIGLNNPTLLRNGFSSAQIWSQQPDVLIFYSKNGRDVAPDLGNGNDYRLAQSDGMKHFHHAGSVFFNWGYYLMVFVRNNAIEREAIEKYFRKKANNFDEIIMMNRE